MLVDLRTYTARPGTLKSHLDLYEKGGFATQQRHLGKPLAYLVADVGVLNSYTHLWVFDDAADRANRRRAMEADPAWAAYRKESAAAGYLVSQENRLMVPASFCPLSRSHLDR